MEVKDQNITLLFIGGGAAEAKAILTQAVAKLDAADTIEAETNTTDVVDTLSLQDNTVATIKVAVNKRREELSRCCSSCSRRKIESVIYAQIRKVFDVNKSEDIPIESIPTVLRFIEISTPCLAGDG